MFFTSVECTVCDIYIYFLIIIIKHHKHEKWWILKNNTLAHLYYFYKISNAVNKHKQQHQQTTNKVAKI